MPMYYISNSAYLLICSQTVKFFWREKGFNKHALNATSEWLKNDCFLKYTWSSKEIIKLWAICLEPMDFVSPLTRDFFLKEREKKEARGFGHTVFNPICFGFNLQNKAGLLIPNYNGTCNQSPH